MMVLLFIFGLMFAGFLMGRLYEMHQNKIFLRETLEKVQDIRKILKPRD